MTRGDKTTLDKLKPGDRFYKACDLAKTVHEVSECPPDKNGKVFCFKSGGNTKFPDPIKGSVEVIYLRSKNPN